EREVAPAELARERPDRVAVVLEAPEIEVVEVVLGGVVPRVVADEGEVEAAPAGLAEDREVGVVGEPAVDGAEEGARDRAIEGPQEVGEPRARARRLEHHARPRGTT